MNCAIVIINYNGASDTITCLNTLLPVLEADDSVVIIENGSSDNSYETLIGYFNAIKKQVYELDGTKPWPALDHERLLLYKHNINSGFGGGNNIALRELVNQKSKFDCVVLLNNDTKVNSTSIRELKKSFRSKQNCAAVGPLIFNMDTDIVQCAGVWHYPWLGVSKLIAKNTALSTYQNTQYKAFDYLNGACILLNLEALSKVGLFDEAFFLYSEELDLQLRLQKQGYTLDFCPNATIMHSLSAATGSRKYLFYYYYNFSCIRLNKMHYGFFVTASSVLVLTGVTILRAFPSLKNTWWGIKAIFKAVVSK